MYANKDFIWIYCHSLYSPHHVLTLCLWSSLAVVIFDILAPLKLLSRFRLNLVICLIWMSMFRNKMCWWCSSGSKYPPIDNLLDTLLKITYFQAPSQKLWKRMIKMTLPIQLEELYKYLHLVRVIGQKLIRVIAHESENDVFFPVFSKYLEKP